MSGKAERDRREFGGVEEWGDKSIAGAYAKGQVLDLGDAGKVPAASLPDPFVAKKRPAKKSPRAPGT